MATIKAICSALLSPLRSIPGPFLARFTRLWEAYALRRFDFATYNTALHEAYGPVVRLAPNRYSINDAEGAKLILGARTNLDKSNFYYPMGDPFEYNLFSVLSSAAHAGLRSPIATLYLTKSLLCYESALDKCNRDLLERLQGLASREEEFNVRELMQQYAFDVIGEITVGSRFGLLASGADESGVIKAIDETVAYGAVVGLVPELHWWIGKLGALLHIDPSFARVKSFVALCIDERTSRTTQPSSGGQDFLDKLLGLESAGKATRRDTFNACLSNIAAGSDTVAIALSSVIAYLSMHPSCLGTLRQKLDEAVKKGELSDPATFHEAQKVPYLKAVVNEALRIHPVLGQPLVRVVGKDGAYIANHYFPPGTEVGVNPWAFHRNTSVFGTNASEFQPERWIEDGNHMQSTCLNFGAGPRGCIGKNISLMEMLKVVPQIVRKFDFEIVPDTKTGQQVTWRTAFLVKPRVLCRVTQRSTRFQDAALKLG
ncbi:pisatin demethylase [Phaeosphaeriaceae sp. PMI808]|nr:pisatin demethylase [Phaeosphaeriaceae sp. PMI808]